LIAEESQIGLTAINGCWRLIGDSKDWLLSFRTSTTTTMDYPPDDFESADYDYSETSADPQSRWMTPELPEDGLGQITLITACYATAKAIMKAKSKGRAFPGNFVIPELVTPRILHDLFQGVAVIQKALLNPCK
jgi:hypothetical protein